jgi:hypothetical protein
LSAAHLWNRYFERYDCESKYPLSVTFFWDVAVLFGSAISNLPTQYQP